MLAVLFFYASEDVKILVNAVFADLIAALVAAIAASGVFSMMTFAAFQLPQPLI
ncbi:hypothetical protein Q31b_51940 [Novipirellula aureliae]|uniref:Uncharacterized protein n=1 Tax=Novipirellula aureliae TaxID=2527966 RepID=A0A5C6DLG9_9BACT|nr:hypothetical protein [Novipirellula aureliae]TWU35759.1 hypothetical protein Q31b_51940 [Novipirellula aureliae]